MDVVDIAAHSQNSKSFDLSNSSDMAFERSGSSSADSTLCGPGDFRFDFGIAARNAA
jgi:hypothetical protein